jgi:hypothetical protein
VWLQERVKEYIQKLKQLTQPKGNGLSLMLNVAVLSLLLIHSVNRNTQYGPGQAGRQSIHSARRQQCQRRCVSSFFPPLQCQLLPSALGGRTENERSEAAREEKKENKRKAPKKKEKGGKNKKSIKAKSPKKKLKN